MMGDINNDWDEVLSLEFCKPYYLELQKFLKKEYASETIYPPREYIFEALKKTSFAKTKVVILGQDPYYNEKKAHGMSFSVQPGVKLPPSLLNIYKEIEAEFDIVMPRDYGCLNDWALNGVLLLNTVLTVRQNQPNSHKMSGWQIFTDSIISALNKRDTPCVFLLWGNNAKAKKAIITNENHLVLTCNHPSPLSAYNGFFGCNHFKKANEFLESHNLQGVDWQIKKRQ